MSEAREPTVPTRDECSAYRDGISPMAAELMERLLAEVERLTAFVEGQAGGLEVVESIVFNEMQDELTRLRDWKNVVAAAMLNTGGATVDTFQELNDPLKACEKVARLRERVAKLEKNVKDRLRRDLS